MNKAKTVIFRQPTNMAMSVWRYLDLPQLIHLLSTSSLYLPRADLLNDNQEGVLLKTTKSRHHADLAKDYIHLHEHIRKSMFISSWHISEEESYAMWRLYSITPFGLAIRTAYKNLANCYTDKDVYIGCVNYINYLTEDISNNNYHYYFMNKRKCFDYEQEVRLIKYVPSTIKSRKNYPLGIQIPINLKKVIQYIYISPMAEDWYYDVVKLTLKKFSPALSKKLRWSNI